MRTIDIVVVLSLSSLVAIGCDTSTSSTSDGGDATTTDGPMSDDGGVDASLDSPAEAAVEGGDASAVATEGGEAAIEAGEAAIEAGEAGDATTADASDALSLPDAIDAPSLDAIDAPSLGDSGDSGAAADADSGD